MTAKKKPTTTAVAKMDNIPAIVSMLEDKLKSLAHITDSKYKTSGSLEGIGDIKSMTDIRSLIKANASINTSSKAYDDSAKELKLNTYPIFEIGGHDVEAWKADIRLRIEIINQKETVDKLNYFKEKAEKFLSEDDQKQTLFNEMSAFLKK